MRVLAQQGFGPKDRVTRGLADGVISGTILSPRYLNGDEGKRDVVLEMISKGVELGGQVLMDPELYAAPYVSHPASNLGNLETWDYFRMPRRSALISGVAIPGMIRSALEVQAKLGLTEWIAPNVYVDAADSIETAISLNIISQTKAVASELGASPVFATLALSREAVMNRAEFQDIFDALTATDSPPDGFYILMGSQGANESGDLIRSDLYHPQVIAGWMYMNYVLSINGLRVINGCCHLLSPLLGICGAESAASGWFSGLRQFSMSRYVRTGAGGQYPLVRYVSNPLLARVKQTDYLAYAAILPQISNGLPHDRVYMSELKDRADEALQSWEALSALCATYCTGDLEQDLDRFAAHIKQAQQLWVGLQQAGVGQDVEANMELLGAMDEAIRIFKEWAEIA
jgi:hypothetical protein